MFRMDLVINVRIESAETIIAAIVGDVCPDGLCFGIHQIHDTRRRGAVAIVNHAAMNGAKFRIAFLVLGKNARASRENNQHNGKE